MSGFDGEDAALMREARTIAIETSSGPAKPAHRAIIWVVVDGDGRAFVRSWLGERGRWYRELAANPHGVVEVANRRIPVHAKRADAAGIETCSLLLRRKHRSSKGSLLSMLRDEILDTTLELEPSQP